MPTTGILAIGTSVAQGEMSHAELAAIHGLPEQAVRRVIGTTRIFASSETAGSLAIRAAQRCVEQAGIGVDEIDAIVWCSASKRPSCFVSGGLVQHALGAHRAFTTDLGYNCS